MPDAATHIFPIETLRDFSTRVFVHCGLTEEDARLAADVLASSDLRGIESHGIARLWAYVKLIEETGVNLRPRISIVRETESTATVDGDHGLGLVVGPKANQIAIDKAAAAGTGWVAVRGSSHYGIAGYYPLMALKHEMIGWSMTNCSPSVAPLWGSERRLGTNPIAIAFPAGKQRPIVIDMSTSVASGGKVEIARRNGENLPDGWLIDAEGRPTDSSEELFRGGCLLPLGADYAHGGHKGYCLAAMVDLLSGVLSGAQWGPFVPAFIVSNMAGASPRGAGTGHFFGAMRIDAFSDVVQFKERVDAWILNMRDTRPQPGTDGPIIPGDPEYQAEVERANNGVPISPPVLESLRTVALQTGVAFDGA